MLLWAFGNFKYKIYTVKNTILMTTIKNYGYFRILINTIKSTLYALVPLTVLMFLIEIGFTFNEGGTVKSFFTYEFLIYFIFHDLMYILYFTIFILVLFIRILMVKKQK